MLRQLFLFPRSTKQTQFGQRIAAMISTEGIYHILGLIYVLFHSDLNSSILTGFPRTFLTSALVFFLVEMLLNFNQNPSIWGCENQVQKYTVQKQSINTVPHFIHHTKLPVSNYSKWLSVSPRNFADYSKVQYKTVAKLSRLYI